MNSLSPSHPSPDTGDQILIMLRETVDPKTPGMVAREVDRLHQAELKHFVRTIYSDYNRLAADVWREARETSHPEKTFTQAINDLEGLYAAFGDYGPVQFPYIHDFIYGYDWVKFCHRTNQWDHAPFSAPFRAYMDERASSIIASIAKDTDPRYPRDIGPGGRNITNFSRDSESETRLWPLLRDNDLLPFAAWELDGPTAPRPHYHQLREAFVSQNV